MLRYKSSFALMIFIGIAACRSNSSSDQGNEDFEIFYKKFNADLQFQNSRIKYPLIGKKYAEENSDPEFDYTWTLDDHLDFDIPALDTSIFKTKREYEGDMVKEHLFIDASEFMIDYTFKLESGKWYLIFYSDNSEFYSDNSEED
jgi:hypothetical protein